METELRQVKEEIAEVTKENEQVTGKSQVSLLLSYPHQKAFLTEYDYLVYRRVETRSDGQKGAGATH